MKRHILQFVAITAILASATTAKAESESTDLRQATMRAFDSQINTADKISAIRENLRKALASGTFDTEEMKAIRKEGASLRRNLCETHAKLIKLYQETPYFTQKEAELKNLDEREAAEQKDKLRRELSAMIDAKKFESKETEAVRRDCEKIQEAIAKCDFALAERFNNLPQIRAENDTIKRLTDEYRKDSEELQRLLEKTKSVKDVSAADK